jgi:hypothetical protein
LGGCRTKQKDTEGASQSNSSEYQRASRAAAVEASRKEFGSIRWRADRAMKAGRFR